MWQHHFNSAISRLSQLDRQDWFLVLLAAAVVAALCWRGFHSRSEY